VYVLKGKKMLGQKQNKNESENPKETQTLFSLFSFLNLDDDAQRAPRDFTTTARPQGARV